MAFDPETDDPRLLRTVVQLQRLSAEAATRTEAGEITTVDEHLAEALATLERLAKIQKVAGQIRSSANMVAAEAGGLQADLVRLLSQARTALAGAAAGVCDHAA